MFGFTRAAMLTPGVPICSAEKPLTIEMPRSGYLNRCVEGTSEKAKPYGILLVTNVKEPFSGTTTDEHISRTRVRKSAMILDCDNSRF